MGNVHRKDTQAENQFYEEESMKLFRRLSVAFLGICFCLGLVVATSYAQPGRARWEGNRGLHRGWTIGRHRGWENRGRRSYYRNRYEGISWRERRRLALMRYRMYNSRNRNYGDGYLSRSERRRLARRAARYRATRYSYSNW